MAAPATTGGEEVFGDWLRGRLRQIDSSPAQLARHLGTTTVEVEAWLAGRRAPTAAQCERIGSLLGVPARQVRRLAGVASSAAVGASDPPVVAPRAGERVAVERPGHAVDKEMALGPRAHPRAAVVAPTEPAAMGSGVAVAAADAAAGQGDTSTPAVTLTSERPARSPRPRRERPAPEPVAPPTPLIRPEQVAALRALADELVEAGRAHDERRAEVERLRAECARLEAENARLRDQHERLRGILAGEPGR